MNHSSFPFMTQFSIPDSTIKTAWQICNESLTVASILLALFSVIETNNFRLPQENPGQPKFIINQLQVGDKTDISELNFQC